MIIICASQFDPSAALVCTQLAAMGSAYHLLDLDRYPEGYRLRVRWQGGQLVGELGGEDWQVDLADISAVYLRYPGQAQYDAGRAEAQAALNLLLDQLPACVVNRPSLGQSNHSKPHQAMLIAASGLRPPPTLVTNDPIAAATFVAAQPDGAIYKSLSSMRSIVRRVDEGQLARLPLLAHSPSQFQAFIVGDNVRVHIVGEEIIATHISTNAVDYRYTGSEDAVKMQATSLPQDVADACLRLTQHLGLALVGIDLMRTADGTYYCFEANPMPAFAYFERVGGQRISLALAKMLQAGQANCLTNLPNQAKETIMSKQDNPQREQDATNEPFIAASDRPSVGESTSQQSFGAGKGNKGLTTDADITEIIHDMKLGKDSGAEDQLFKRLQEVEREVSRLHGELAQVSQQLAPMMQAQGHLVRMAHQNPALLKQSINLSHGFAASDTADLPRGDVSPEQLISEELGPDSD